MPDEAPTTLDEVLIIAHGGDAGPVAFVLTKAFKESGYSVSLCNVAADGAKVKADKLLEEEMGIGSYKGMVFLDDGGDAKSAVALAKKADSESLAVAGLGQGCAILHDAGLLKDKFLCSGLPEDFYKGSKKVNAPAVRADNIITGMGSCSESFAMLVLDALGGDVKKVVQGADPESLNSPEAAELASDPAMVSKAMAGLVDVDRTPGVRVACVMRRGSLGWLPLGEQDEAIISTAERACLAFQSTLDNPEGANELGVVIKVRDKGPAVVGLNPAPPRGPGGDRWILERELADQGIWLQPDGKVAVSDGDELRKMDPLDAVKALQSAALAATRGEIAAKGDRRARLVARRARHRLALACRLFRVLEDSGEVKLAGPYDSTVCGPYSNLDLPMTERVWEWEEGDDWLKDRDKAINNLPRYNPEYFGDSEEKDEGGVGYYFVWNEPRREPTSWEGILQGDGINPTRKILQRR